MFKFSLFFLYIWGPLMFNLIYIPLLDRHIFLYSHPVYGKFYRKHFYLNQAFMEDVRVRVKEIKFKDHYEFYFLMRFIKKHFGDGDFYKKIDKLLFFYNVRVISYYLFLYNAAFHKAKYFPTLQLIKISLKKHIYNIATEIIVTILFSLILFRDFLRARGWDFANMFFIFLTIFLFRFQAFKDFLSLSKGYSLISLTKDYLWFWIRTIFFVDYWIDHDLIILTKKFFKVFCRFSIIETFFVFVYIFFCFLFLILSYCLVPFFSIFVLCLTFYYFIVHLFCTQNAFFFIFFIGYWRNFVKYLTTIYLYEDILKKYCINYYNFFLGDAIFSFRFTKIIFYIFVFFTGYFLYFVMIVFIGFFVIGIALCINHILRAFHYWLHRALFDHIHFKSYNDGPIILRKLFYLGWDIPYIGYIKNYYSQNGLLTLLDVWDIYFLSSFEEFFTNEFFINFKNNYFHFFRKLCLKYYKNEILIFCLKIFFPRNYDFSFIPIVSKDDRLSWRLEFNWTFYEFLFFVFETTSDYKNVKEKLLEADTLDLHEIEKFYIQEALREELLSEKLTFWQRLYVFWKYLMSVIFLDFGLFLLFSVYMPFYYYTKVWFLYGYLIRFVVSERMHNFFKIKNIKKKLYESFMFIIKYIYKFFYNKIFNFFNFFYYYFIKCPFYFGLSIKYIYVDLKAFEYSFFIKRLIYKKILRFYKFFDVYYFYFFLWIHLRFNFFYFFSLFLKKFWVIFFFSIVFFFSFIYFSDNPFFFDYLSFYQLHIGEDINYEKFISGYASDENNGKISGFVDILNLNFQQRLLLFFQYIFNKIFFFFFNKLYFLPLFLKVVITIFSLFFFHYCFRFFYWFRYFYKNIYKKVK